jgi:DNA-binding CsgD family transcriptional regulator
MLDEISVYTRLNSTLYGALVQAVEVAGRAVEADLAAGRVFNCPTGDTASYVTSARHVTGRRHHGELDEWPRDDDSLFAFVRDRSIRDGVFRPRDLMDELEFSRGRFFHRIETHCPVNDAFCVCFEMIGDAWCTLSFLRCGSSAAFEERHLNSIERFQPTLAQRVTEGYRQEIRPTAAATPLSPSEMLAKLSQTERQVLSFIRSDHTERAIGEKMRRSPHTIHVHVKNIYRKLGVRSRKQLLNLFADA